MSYSLPSAVLAEALPPLTCLVVNSELPVAQALADCVRRLPALALAGTCSSPEQALAQLQARPVDVLFLAMELPLLAGLALLRSLGPAPAVVLTSAYPDYALQGGGCGYSVVDCLRTPVEFHRFLPMANRLVSRGWLAPAAVAPCRAASFYFWVDGQLVQARLADVLYLEKLLVGCRVQTLGGEFITTQSFSVLADQLPEPRFLRVNSSFVVALRQVTPVAGNALAVGGQRIPVGPALADELLARAFQTSL